MSERKLSPAQELARWRALLKPVEKTDQQLEALAEIQSSERAITSSADYDLDEDTPQAIHVAAILDLSEILEDLIKRVSIQGQMIDSLLEANKGSNGTLNTHTRQIMKLYAHIPSISIPL